MEINEHIKKEQKQFQIPIPSDQEKDVFCDLCLEPFRLEGENRCISLCEKCWGMGDVESGTITSGK
jgi:hypothetical protein